MKYVKCSVLGDKEVHSSKLQLIKSFFTNSFPGEKEIEIPDNNYSAIIMLEDLPIKLQFFDSPHQEEYRKYRIQDYSQTDVILMCFSLSRPKTLENIENIWFPEVHEFCPRVPIILVGLESELHDDKDIEPIPTSKGEEVAKLLRIYK